MKRKFLTIIAILLVIAMAGCATLAKENRKEADPNVAQGGQAKETLPQFEKTTKTAEEAKKIAFDHASVKEADAKDLEVELDNDGGVLHFDVSFDAGEYDYDYEIDAYSGNILRSEKERDNNKQAVTTTETKKTKDQAKKIALNHAGVKESAVRDLEVELDKENGKEIYEVTFESGSYDYEYEIDAYTGKILHSEKERDD